MFTVSASGAGPAAPAPQLNWPVYGGQGAQDHYSILSQINRTNVKDLVVAVQPSPFDKLRCGTEFGNGLLTHALKAQLNFWSIRTTICPEAYIQVNVQPGETKTWTIRYRFFAK